MIPGDNNGVEYFLPVMMSKDVNENRISMERVVEVCSTTNAKRFGLYPRKGVIVGGADADMVIVDLHRRATVDDDLYHTMEPGTRRSTVGDSPISGRTLSCEVAVEDGELLAEPGGRTSPEAPKASPLGDGSRCLSTAC